MRYTKERRTVYTLVMSNTEFACISTAMQHIIDKMEAENSTGRNSIVLKDYKRLKKEINDCWNAPIGDEA